MPSAGTFSSRGTLEVGVCGSSSPTETMAVGPARKQAKWLNLATTPFSWTSKPGAHLGTEKGELMLLAQHRETGRHLDCYNGWKMIFLDCFLGNIGLCLEDHSALSIKWRAFLSPPLVTHQEAAEQWSQQSKESTAPPSWREKAPICVMSFTQPRWKRSGRVSVRLAERSYLHSCHWWPPWTGIWGQSKWKG